MTFLPLTFFHKLLFECFLSEAITINIVPTNNRIPSMNIDQITNGKILANVTPAKFKVKPIANIILCGNDFILFKISLFPPFSCKISSLLSTQYPSFVIFFTHLFYLLFIF
jgi:hypothetical protein